jgi:two-component system chemotaxis response regulator CheY
MKVAIIEDSVFMRKVTAMTVKRLCPQAELFEFAEAGEALALLGQISPDIITLDLLMPGMSGLEFLQQARLRQLSARIIVITADVQPVVRQRCLDSGAHAFVEKPITLAKLKAALEEVAAPTAT